MDGNGEMGVGASENSIESECVYIVGNHFLMGPMILDIQLGF